MLKSTPWGTRPTCFRNGRATSSYQARRNNPSFSISPTTLRTLRYSRRKNGWHACWRAEPGISERRAKLVALIEHMDAGIGQVLECLEQQGLTDSTIVVFTSDNGGQLDVGANNGLLRDGKGTVYEGGLKVPACIRWPGYVEAGTTTELRAMTMDIYPTLLDAVGAEYPETIDGVSFLPTLLGEQQDELRELWFFRRREGGAQFMGKTIEAVRMGDWKLLQNSPFTPMELYNLASDPLEQNNLIDSERQVFNQLSAALRRQIQQYGSVPWQQNSE